MASRSTLMLHPLLAQHLPSLAGAAVVARKQMGTAGARQPLAHS
ncbi:MAG: hypothetical protein Q8M77_03170 [Hydrogenophaga sp.]|nr:hypothetical protein [Hydrogenophaga sp. IBVHS1]MDP3250893.1 hypothetical protein [Hydrogenophaga sp.]